MLFKIWLNKGSINLTRRTSRKNRSSRNRSSRRM